VREERKKTRSSVLGKCNEAGNWLLSNYARRKDGRISKSGLYGRDCKVSGRLHYEGGKNLLRDICEITPKRLELKVLLATTLERVFDAGGGASRGLGESERYGRSESGD